MEEDFQQQGLKLETKILRYDRNFVPDRAVCERLKLRPDATVGSLTMLWFVEGRAIAYDRTFLPDFVAEEFEPEELGDRPFLEVLRDLTGIRVASLDWEIEIEPSSSETATALGLTPGVLPVRRSVRSRRCSHPGAGRGTSLRRRQVLCWRTELQVSETTGLANSTSLREQKRSAR
jgi:DNA-binding GntR family transcriptional regulator